MKSTIRVDYDFDKNETFIQLNIPNSEPHYMVDVDVKLDLADKHLKNFVEQSSVSGLELVYPESNSDNNSPQIRLGEVKEGGYSVQENSDAFIKFLRDKSISYKANGGWTRITSEYSAFKLGLEWGIYKLNNAPRD